MAITLQALKCRSTPVVMLQCHLFVVFVSKEFRGTMPEAYERLLLDALEGDASLFARADEVEAAWRVCDPILQAWQSTDRPTLFQYEPGFWGPDECRLWMLDQGREWFDNCPVLG